MNATASIQVICMQTGRVEGRSFDTPMDAAKFLLGQCSLSELRRLVLYDMRAIQRDAAERGIMGINEIPVGINEIPVECEAK